MKNFIRVNEVRGTADGTQVLIPVALNMNSIRTIAPFYEPRGALKKAESTIHVGDGDHRTLFVAETVEEVLALIDREDRDVMKHVIDGVKETEDEKLAFALKLEKALALQGVEPAPVLELVKKEDGNEE